MTTRIETRRDERTGVDLQYLVTEYDGDTPTREVIYGAATGVHFYLLHNRERLAEPGNLDSARVPMGDGR